ncbi:MULTISPECIES: Crp/Fnr family transcriptional regulator [Bacillus]|uniref:Cyclic nucleotide-binding protein n=1 Tax=Bacillus mycoides TaxID=1405 RepID=A0A0A0WTA8_BACMY|nr:Crp/Fnr family transcriptional regulator [Bacillus mycoides]EEL07257.1 Cyclic nucleotide-binding protein [Bacillus cereus BDRD-ST196]AIW86380.1 cyclic nucleotide-binding domain protein [Bacillus mycoides]MBE7127020.1 Crp/Fnr family transcriptional regulator [Bacillus mycoides]MCQ6529394.1 Crp/Fnr family transcriptional regulator [Bacillus mycoides]MEC5240880.1 Crp/Fnr family transcriptional regulator [Bacillus mycoides]
MKEILMKYMTNLTTLSEEQQRMIVEELQIEEYKKGTVLLGQGDVPSKCYFVLKGCVRQHCIDESGKEVTSNFYTEEQAIANFNHHKQDKLSPHTLTCLEDCLVVVGDLYSEKDMYKKYSQLEEMTRQMIEYNFGEVQEELTLFITSTPEERYKSLLQKRPHLINRVPQYQLASYLGITPESLSRIKKRLKQ